MLLRTAAIVSMACLACSAAMAQSAGENFDHLPAQEISPANPLALEHFRVEFPFGGRAVIRPAEDQDELSSGMVLGAPADWNLASLMLHFEQPWKRLTFTLVLPPTSERDIRSLITLYGNDAESPSSNATLFWHRMDRQRIRVELVRSSAEPPFQRVLLHLFRGAYVDNIEMDPSRAPAEMTELPAPALARNP